MTEQEKRMFRCCFTGHRPEKISIDEIIVQNTLEVEIRKAVDEGYKTFISGMARGIDIWAARIVLKLKKEGSEIHLICACPFLGFEERWADYWKYQYRSILKEADIVRFICSSYSRSCFQIRNEWMINHSNRLIAFYNGEPGGTLNTIKYAQKKNIEIRYINKA